MKPVCKMTATLALSLVAVRPSSAQQKRPITPKDCLSVADLQADESTWRSTILFSPDSGRVAYPVTSPNLETNQNEVKLYVRKLALNPNIEKPVFVGDISQVRWRPDSRHLTFLRRENGRRVIEELDSVTGDHRVMFKAESDIPEYSIDSGGRILVYAADAPREMTDGLAPQAMASGYRIPFEASADANWPKRRLFLVRRTEDGWTAPASIIIESPLSGQPLNGLAHALNSDLDPVLSPDGSKLLLSYWDFSEEMPDEWRASGFMQLRNIAGVIQAFKLLVLYDIKSGKSSLTPLKTPWATSAPEWSSDGNAFVIAAAPPIDSVLEQENITTRLVAHSHEDHLFWVELTTGKFDDVAPKMAFPWAGPLLWDRNGDLFVQVASLDTITRYSRVDGQWKEGSSSQIPIRVGTQVATDGHYVVAEYSDTTTPPQLLFYRWGDKQGHIFSKLNPQFDDLTLARPQEVHWTTSTGFDASGLLLLPPNYMKGMKYPLVIQTKPFTSSFVCGFGNFPSFAPQPFANAGIMYLGSIPTKGSTQREEDFYPKGYPGAPGVGGLAEAAFAMDWWDSAINALDQQGFIDRNRVGIIGFSRTGWYTEFILAHSKIHYQAATVADNVQYSMGEYWLDHDPGTIKSLDLIYGGPPYGATLKNWLDYSVSFNLDKIHTPLLMEEMGSGVPYDNQKAPPIALASSFEVFTGLNRLKRPVEMYYYPTEGHTPEHPQARLATMQRNVDWYRFWLQDYERPNPEDPQQYVRWGKLREIYQEDLRKTAFTAVKSRSGTVQQ
jgi:dipeptidyl aminopeptidase/acylaminoacyl peptidase